MNIKTTMMGAALSLTLLPLAARAEHEYSPVEPEQQYQQQYQPEQYQQPYQEAPAYQTARPPMPRDYGRRRGHGRYELRTVQQWVAGRYQQVWVPEQCSMRERQHGWVRTTGSVCIPAHYGQQWTPAHYESVQQWVWVSNGAGGRHYFGRR